METKDLYNEGIDTVNESMLVGENRLESNAKKIRFLEKQSSITLQDEISLAYFDFFSALFSEFSLNDRTCLFQSGEKFKARIQLGTKTGKLFAKRVADYLPELPRYSIQDRTVVFHPWLNGLFATTNVVLGNVANQILVGAESISGNGNLKEVYIEGISLWCKIQESTRSSNKEERRENLVADFAASKYWKNVSIPKNLDARRLAKSMKNTASKENSKAIKAKEASVEEAQEVVKDAIDAYTETVPTLEKKAFKALSQSEKLAKVLEDTNNDNRFVIPTDEAIDAMSDISAIEDAITSLQDAINAAQSRLEMLTERRDNLLPQEITLNIPSNLIDYFMQKVTDMEKIAGITSQQAIRAVYAMTEGIDKIAFPPNAILSLPAPAVESEGDENV